MLDSYSYNDTDGGFLVQIWNLTNGPLQYSESPSLEILNYTSELPFEIKEMAPLEKVAEHVAPGDERLLTHCSSASTLRERVGCRKHNGEAVQQPLRQ